MKKIIPLLLLALTYANTWAQNDTISRMVLVESTYKPIVGKAEKRHFVPDEMTPSMEKEPVVYLHEVSTLNNLSRNPLPPKSYTLDKATPLPGLVQLGFGNYNSIKALAYYRHQFNPQQALSTNAFLDGWSGKIKQLDDTRWHSSMHKYGVHLNYWHQLGEAKLHIHTGAESYRYNYRNMPTMTADTLRQTANLLFADANLCGTYGNKLTYHLQAAYTHFGRSALSGMLLRNAENTFKTSASATYSLEQWGSASVSATNHILSYSGISNYKNYISFTLTPQWHYQHHHWQLNAGLNLDFQNIKGTRIQASPNLQISYVPENHFAIDFIADGGRDMATFSKLFRLSPYWNSLSQLRSSYDYLNIRLVSNYTPIEGLHLHLKGGYRITADALLETPMDSAGIVYTGIANRDVHRIYASAKADYSYKQIFTISGMVTYSKWTNDTSNLPPARVPQLELEWLGSLRIIEGLTANAGFHYVKFTTLTGDMAYPQIANLHIGIDYLFNRKLSLFINGNNLLNKCYEPSLGYASQGFSILGGAIFKF